MATKRRKTTYRRRGGLHFLYQIASVILVLAAVIGGIAVFFKVETVEVTGNQKYSTEQVITVADIGAKANLFLISKDKITHQLLDNLPYVEKVEVHRKFPTTLQIVLTERPPLAAIETDDTWWILDQEGKIMESVGEELAKQYTEVSGITLQAPVTGEQAAVMPEYQTRLQSLIGLLSALHERDMAQKISWIDLTAETEVEMECDGRMLVSILVNADFDRKVWVLKEMMNVLDADAQGVIDLRSERAYFRPS